jgi:preprotein translocase subunit SecA
MRIFAGEWVKKALTWLGMQEGQAIESRMVSRRIEGAQKKVEERNFDVRKNLLEYDEVMDEQRKRVYGYRQRILDGADCKLLIMEMIDQEIDRYLDQFLADDYGADSFAKWASAQLSVELESNDFRAMDFQSAESYAKDQAERMSESLVFDSIEENLPADEAPDEWNWEALAKTGNTRWKLNVRDRDLKRLGRDDVATYLIEKAHEAVQKTDLSAGARLLEPDYGLQAASAWVRHKFAVELAVDDLRSLELPAIKDLVRDRARQAYEEKEVEFPVIAGLYHFTTHDPGGHKRYDREKLVEWARDRFGVELSLEDLRNKQRHEIRALLVEHSRRAIGEGRQRLQEARSRLEEALAVQTAAAGSKTGTEPAAAAGNGRLQSLLSWLKQTVEYEVPPELMTRPEREELGLRIATAIDQRYRPEMRRMERSLVLELLDTAWKDHLLVMDHLRGSVGLRGYAQVDPKVEYKREGMRTFDAMWESVGQRVTDLIFRMEQLDEGFIGSQWTEAKEVHQEAPAATEIVEQQQAAIEGTQSGGKHEPIRNRDKRVGRNDPCPCGSGKKYKVCCGRKG